MFIVQRPVLDFNEFFALDESDRLTLVLTAINAEKLLRALDARGSPGRDGYAARVLWSALVAGVVHRARSIAELRRNLIMNPYLRYVCGILCAGAVPSEATFSRFLAELVEHKSLLDECIEDLVRRFRVLAPHFGEDVVADATDIHAYSRYRKDGSSDPDATWGAKGSKEASSKSGKKSKPPVAEGQAKGSKEKTKDKYWWFVVPSTSLSRLTGESPVKVGIRPAL